jgi:Rps23 Pro-64 3,4-dihydroxylase Tpa1-like proline 4-hydroxylase
MFAPQTDSRTTMDWLLSNEVSTELARLAENNAHEYSCAEPFPHLVLDDFLPAPVADAALRNFPQPKSLRWVSYDEQTERKLAFPVAEALPPSLREVLYFLNTPIVLRFLEDLTGIKGIIPDPYFKGGGLHQIERDGFLNVHADFNWYEKLKLDRRINLLLYLNRDWQEEYGGYLELWDREMKTCVKRVLPIFNRCVIFSTTSEAYHGHPIPLACPPGWSRKSIATYYYTNGRPEEERNDSHSTLFQERPGTAPKGQPSKFRGAKKILRSLLPPILTDAYYRMREPER